MNWVVLLLERVTLRIHIRPIGIDILRDLVGSGDLDAAVVGEMPTFTLSAAQLEWLGDTGRDCVP